MSNWINKTADKRSSKIVPRNKAFKSTAVFLLPPCSRCLANKKYKKLEFTISNNNKRTTIGRRMGNVGEEDKEQGEINSKCDYWTKRWVENKTGWHVNSINGNLMLYLNVLTGFSDNHSVTPTTLARNAQKKFFVPLCGKTRDLAYLRGLGFQIFAVECAQLAIEALDKENNFKLKYDEKDSVYHTEDGKLKIFYGDFFKCPLEKWGPFDYVWDRGSLIAVEYSHRPAYIKMMQRSVKVQNKYYPFRYLLETVEYDRTKYAGPPRVVEERDVKELYSAWTNFQLLEKYTLPEAHNIRKIEGMGPNCNQALYIITPKKLL